jgi:hypothetical protein
MRKLEPLKYLAGSIVIYYAMAACSSAGTKGFANGSGASGSGGASSSGGASGGAISDANADQTESGSRLKAEYFVGGDGSKQWDGVFLDSERKNEHCAFQTAGDGAIRCLPSAVSNGGYWADSACTTPLGVGDPTCTQQSSYVIVPIGSAACGGTTLIHIFPVIAVHTSGQIYQGGQGTSQTCTAVSTPTSFPLLAVDKEILPSTFQSATVQTM